MASDDLEHSMALLEGKLTPALVARVVRPLLRQRHDSGSGVGAVTLVMHLAGDLTQRHADISRMYGRLKPALRSAVERSLSLKFVDGG